MVINKKKILELDQIQRARSSNSVSVLPCEKGTYQMKLEFGVFRIRYQSIPIYVRSNSAKFHENWSIRSKTDIWGGDHLLPHPFARKKRIPNFLLIPVYSCDIMRRLFAPNLLKMSCLIQTSTPEVIGVNQIFG